MARKSAILQVRVTASMLERIDGLGALSRAEAVRALIERGLDTASKPVFDFVKAQRAVAPVAEEQGPSTYSSISAIQREQDRAARELKPGLLEETVITDATMPKLPGGPWSAGDHFGKERPTGVSVDGVDPSGTTRNRGPG